jgi:hypothetical protein
MDAFGSSWAHLGGGGVRILLTAILAAATAAGPGYSRAVAGEATPPPPLRTDAEREAFLLEGEVVEDRAIPQGVTLPRRVTLRWGEHEHDAKIQTRDEYKPQFKSGAGLEIDFRDSWRNNAAAYRLDRLLGLGFVPVTVVREYKRQPAAWTWWVDDLLMSDRERHEQKKPPPSPLAWVCQMDVQRLFDQLISNFDRTRENTLIDKDWRLWMIDHSRAFQVFGDLRNEENLPSRCEKRLLDGLRGLDRPTLEKAMEGLLNEKQIDGLLARRDTIVRFYDDAIAARGEPAVLYELPPVSRAERGED